MTSTDSIDAQMNEIIDPAAEIEWLGSGYGGTNDEGVFLGVAEGPVWDTDGGFLVFTDNGRGVRYRYDDVSGVTVLDTDTFNANGQTLDNEGRLVWCEHTGRRVRRREADGSITTVADAYRGSRLNRPNDVIVDSKGAIWFTDPFTFGVDTELDIAGVYRVSPDLARINLVLRDFAFPNGLIFSQDEQTLYVNDTGRMQIRAYDMDYWGADGGRPDIATERVVITMFGDEPGAPDGMKLDAAGRLWCTGPGGIWVIEPQTGTCLGIVPVRGHSVTNFTFGGPDLTTLYFTTYTDFGRIPLRVPGLSVPRRTTESAVAPVSPH
ncbi:gluconolactonase [Mycobacterium sp. JS623]|uniref:SMP-30/gluconolactonase/LRE family protein n=1 Tax=Mycobacterium sp. JS623 TaxID=212767 RepID=UPI0002A557A4|nr:SMP-30/gluconolactonase/LRE family protein [Mycobacterium sp. JS623]AGB22181.1 gluconolactonase [Mycobacterium sp. JS623]